MQAMDKEMGAGTFHPATFLRAIGPEPWRVAYPQACRRPTDGRYGDNPNRLQHYYQFQVLLKPSPTDIQQMYLDSLHALGLDAKLHDIRFVEDNWESPTLGAWGLGWEVWLNGMEITQFTYFQQVGGLTCKPVSGEITYGLERLAMYLQKVDSVYDLRWNEELRYGELFRDAEREQSHYNFQQADLQSLTQNFQSCEKECAHLVEKKLTLPAYEQLLRASHIFNILDARRALAVNERQQHIFRIRKLSQSIAELWRDQREEAGFPLMKKS